MRNSNNSMQLGCAAIFALFFVAIVGLNVVSALHIDSMTCTVKDKEAVRKGDGNQYRVYTHDCGTLSVEDSILSMRFDTADAYGALNPETTYEFTTRGFRIGFLSMFPNIIAFNEVEAPVSTQTQD